jgi:DNA repair protein RecN (Recombination protein N)
MIERLLVKNHLSFERCELEFSQGLIAFTGPSGAGKSVLMQALLSLFGFCESDASLIEAIVDKNLNLSSYGLEEEEPNVFKLIKDKNTRYFINLQNVSRKNITKIASEFVGYLSVRNEQEFENENLLKLLDALLITDDARYEEEIQSYQTSFLEYKEKKARLEEIEEKERKIEELKDFASFEIAKIEEISPKIGEDEELMEFKKSLSKKEKIQESLNLAEEIFNFENAVTLSLQLMEKESSFFDETMNELKAVFEEQRERLNDLDDIDIENLLDRIEKISTLKARYGSIEEILEYKKRKEEELQEYDKISFTKNNLEVFCKERLASLMEKAEKISQKRKSFLQELEKNINSYLKELYMPCIGLKHETVALYEHGIDYLNVVLDSVNVKKISSGEYNRLRLAFIATSCDILKAGSGVLILDEIDANLSGKESMSVANVLKILSKRYQIFAISHQPQLSSVANQHFLITKENGKSSVKLLEDEQRVMELARMVSGENVSEEAYRFARALMENKG